MTLIRTRRIGVMGLLTVGFLASGAQAHEFFIEPESYTVAAGAALVAELRVGEAMEGARQAYVPPNFRRFDVTMAATVTEVPGRAGDRPALNMPAPLEEGLAVVAHVTRDYRITYNDWDKFLAFVTHKDAVWVAQEHAARGLSQERVVEAYSRYAKSLIAVGEGRGADSEVGLLTEIVAQENPYTSPDLTTMSVQVLFDGAPRANAQLEVFEKAADGTVTIELYGTDADGKGQFPVRPGHSYLVDSVMLRALEPVDPGGATWESLWASLTFSVPAPSG